jgi:hypothetical protein
MVQLGIRRPHDWTALLRFSAAQGFGKLGRGSINTPSHPACIRGRRWETVRQQIADRKRSAAGSNEGSADLTLHPTNFGFARNFKHSCSTALGLAASSDRPSSRISALPRLPHPRVVSFHQLHFSSCCRCCGRRATCVAKRQRSR